MDKINANSADKELPIKRFMLYYQLVPDILEARIPYKDEHMSILNELSSRGLVFVGAEVKENFPATFMFEGTSDAVLQEWLTRDPYLKNGLVTDYHFNQIILVAGKLLQ